MKKKASDNWIDGSLYPDTETPAALKDLSSRIDFLSRLCSSWDFGIMPDLKCIDEIKNTSWKEAVDRCRLLTSSSYHLLRFWHHLPRLPFLGQRNPLIVNDPNLKFV